MRDPTVGIRHGLPPWYPTNKAEQDWLRQWTNEQFADLDAAEAASARVLEDLLAFSRKSRFGDLDLSVHQLLTVLVSPTQIEEMKAQAQLEKAKAQARLGNLEPLRRLYSEIAEFLHKPKLKPGRPVDNDDKRYRLRVSAAIDDVHFIRNIWANNYGRWKRPDNDPVTAESIAAGRHGLTATKVKDAMYKRGVRGTVSKANSLTNPLRGIDLEASTSLMNGLLKSMKPTT
jgi:hypothetical protein